MYEKSAKYYDRLYHFKDYATAAQRLHALIQQVVPGARSLLDVACGTGRHLEHLAAHYRCEGLDLDSGLLEQARKRCPDVPLHQANMIDFELGRAFDVITCLFSAIAYVKTPANLRLTLANLARHTNAGGAVFVEPYFTPDRYWADRVTLNIADERDAKIAWMYISRRDGNLGVHDVHYLVGTPSGVEHFVEHHEVGLFTEQEYASAFIDGGLSVEYDPAGLFGRGLYVGRRSFDIGRPAREE